MDLAAQAQETTTIASKDSITRFQRKIESLLYAAVTTRPDIAFATARLSRFLTNPSDAHHQAADRVLNYLKRTQYLCLKYGETGDLDDFVVASDASFADNTLDRKSSQGYVMRLFGGLIGWRANKQDTVTTSTTEAELLALSQAAKEGLYVQRLLHELTVRLDKRFLPIQCDNLQTIHLVNDNIARLQTKLRHVDIHNHWLRQEVQQQRVAVQYVPTGDMIADGLTKALPRGQMMAFYKQLGMESLEEVIKKRRSDELKKEELEMDDLFLDD